MSSQPETGRPDWLSKHLVPIAVAVVSAILVTALTPLGENLRELLFPTKADVTGLVTVEGQGAGGAQLTLDNEPAGMTDEDGTFFLSDVSDGDHTLEIKAVSSSLTRKRFKVDRQSSEEALGNIPLPRLAHLGVEQLSSLSSNGFTYDVTLWIIAGGDVLQRIESVEYTLPSPFPPTPVTVRSGPQTRFCLRRKHTSDGGGGGGFLFYAVVDLGQGQRFNISAAPGPGQPGRPECPITGSTGDGGGSGTPPPPPPVLPPPPPPPPGPPPPAEAVPSVVGQSFQQASGELRAAGFRPVRRAVDNPAPAGTVVDQVPVPGTLYPRGTTVTLTVSAGQEGEAVPDVVGQDEETAIQTLENGGWRVIVQDEATTDPTQDGIVLCQTPKGGAEAKPGSQEVTIRVGRSTGVTEEFCP